MSRRACPNVTSYESAEKFLAGGRNKARRRLARNRCVERLADDVIGIVLHRTVIVAFHADGTETIDTGGWNTVTTKQWINAHSHARVWSDRYQLSVRMHAPEITAPRVQKCRTCHGAGRLPESCYGYRYDYTTSTRQPCEHGMTAGHPNGTRECFRCNGASRADYGSKPVHYQWAGDALRVSATGEPLPDVDTTHWYCTPADTPTTGHKAPAYIPAADTDIVSGGTVLATLGRLVPGVHSVKTCPACGRSAALAEIVPHLNDSHRWTREAIADWLESLDTDLSFTTA